MDLRIVLLSRRVKLDVNSTCFENGQTRFNSKLRSESSSRSTDPCNLLLEWPIPQTVSTMNL
jgi:hypothetical protein